MKIIKTLLFFFISLKGRAQDPITLIIKEGIKKVIVAVDLKMQRLQNETIWLQNAQKTVENELSRLQLARIGEWVEKQRVLYAEYFEELWRVKAALGAYVKVKELVEKQKTLLSEYKSAIALFRQDPHFTAAELAHMEAVYGGLLKGASTQLDALLLVANAFTTQMSDAARLERLQLATAAMDRLLLDLRQFNREARMLARQRAAEKGTLLFFKKLYGL